MFGNTLARLCVLAGFVSLLTACGGGGPGDTLGGGGLGDTVGGDEHTGEPAKGDYVVQSTWDLSAPLSSDRTVGDVVADALILELAGKIPSDSAIEKIDAVVRPPIRREVDANTPAILQPDSELMMSLAGTLASVEVMSELELRDGGLLDDIKGTERIVAFGLEHHGQSYVVTPDEITGTVVEFAAEWKAQATPNGTSLEVDPHRFEIQFGNLVLWLLANTVDTDADELAQLLTDSVPCPAIVTALLDGREALTVEVAGKAYGYDADELTGACESVVDLLFERALGLFAIDTRVEIGGTVNMIDDDGDGRADRLLGSSDFGGHVAVAPEFIAPPLTVRFEATRLE